MNIFDHVIRAESDRFVSILTDADPSAAVPTCPGWVADDLLWHLTEVHAFWAEILRGRAMTDEDVAAAEKRKPARPADTAQCARLFQDQTEVLLQELSSREDAEPAWFWLESAMTVGSTRRMQAHEATMHRVDAERAAGAESAPIDPDLAADGVSHALTVMWAWWSGQAGFTLHPLGGTVRLRATDRKRTWTVQAGRWIGTGASGTEYDEPGVVLLEDPLDTEPAATVSGTAEELYRWLWGRGPQPRVEGEKAALAALRAVRDDGMG